MKPLIVRSSMLGGARNPSGRWSYSYQALLHFIVTGELPPALRLRDVLIHHLRERRGSATAATVAADIRSLLAAKTVGDAANQLKAVIGVYPQGGDEESRLEALVRDVASHECAEMRGRAMRDLEAVAELAMRFEMGEPRQGPV